MNDVTSLVPPPPDVASRWLGDSVAKHRRKVELTGGLGRTRNSVGGGRWLVWLGRFILWTPPRGHAFR
jgi:hypothetical protein